MTTTYWEQYEDPPEVQQPPESPGIKALRAKAEQDSATIRQLKEQLDSLANAQRERTVGDVLTVKGLDPKVAKLIPPDADVENWLSEYGALFGAVKPVEAPEEPSGTPVPNEPTNAPQGVQDAYRAISGSGAGAGVLPAENDAVQQMLSVNSKADLDKLLAEYRNR